MKMLFSGDAFNFSAISPKWAGCKYSNMVQRINSSLGNAAVQHCLGRVT